MKRKSKLFWVALAGTLAVLAAIAGRAEIGDAAPQAAPVNQSPPVISGTAEEGKTLTTTNGNWTGTAPITFTYSWRRCDADGGSCAAIGGTNQNTYVMKKVDVGNTIRVRVTARNNDGSTPSTSVPTAVVRAATAPPSGCDGAAPIPIANVALPNRLIIDGQQISPGVVGRSTPSITLRFHVVCKGKPVQGALVYGDAVPFNQFSTPAEAAHRRRRLGDDHDEPRGRVPRHQQAGAAGDLRPRPQAGRGHPRGRLDAPPGLLPGRPLALGHYRTQARRIHSPPGPCARIGGCRICA